MGYVEQRGAILAHAKSAALTANPTFTNVDVGMPRFAQSKGCRLFYGGEVEPITMPERRDLKGEIISHRTMIVAWWALSATNDAAIAAIDDEAHAFVHALRTALDGDFTLGGVATALEMAHATPDIIASGGARYLTVETSVVSDFTEYAYAP